MKPRILLQPGGLSPEERQWLTGQHDPDANQFWEFGSGPDRAERGRQLLREYAHLIPPGRLAKLERDVAFWDR
jgi:hypothetical protein